MSNKTRLDVLLVEQGHMESRQKAQAVIMTGSVFVDGQRVDKPGTAVPNTAQIEVRGHALPYVSRGGLKLEKAMKTFPLTLTGKVCADIGASTGGFTDCTPIIAQLTRFILNRSPFSNSGSSEMISLYFGFAFFVMAFAVFVP